MWLTLATYHSLDGGGPGGDCLLIPISAQHRDALKAGALPWGKILAAVLEALLGTLGANKPGGQAPAQR